MNVAYQRREPARLELDGLVRAATPDDLPALQALCADAIDELLSPLLSADQLAASRILMGIDSLLVEDGTYFVVEAGGTVAGCGGWSRWATAYGGDHTPGRGEHRRLDPATEPARIRAMYTAPAFARRGVGRRILEECEADAGAAGFRQLELLATVAGRPLYEAVGFRAVAELVDTSAGAPVPLVTMRKPVVGGAGGQRSRRRQYSQTHG
jgi:GNAT superfamily N-acetyltransferase